MEKTPGLLENTNDSCLVLIKTLVHGLPRRQQEPWASGTGCQASRRGWEQVVGAVTCPPLLEAHPGRRGGSEGLPRAARLPHPALWSGTPLPGWPGMQSGRGKGPDPQAPPSAPPEKDAHGGEGCCGEGWSILLGPQAMVACPGIRPLPAPALSPGWAAGERQAYLWHAGFGVCSPQAPPWLSRAPPHQELLLGFSKLEERRPGGEPSVRSGGSCGR